MAKLTFVAFAPYLIPDMKNQDTWRMPGVSGAALLIAVAILIIRFGHTQFPYNETDGK